VILVDAEAITDIDLTSLDTLGELREELSDEGIELWFARVHASVAELMDRYGLADEIGPDRFYLSVEAGAEAFGARRR
jgi:SulP family sulfate permease